MSKDIFRNKQDFAREEFATAMYKPAGHPKNREKASQKAQMDHFGSPGLGRKDRKEKMTDKNGINED